MRPLWKVLANIVVTSWLVDQVRQDGADDEKPIVDLLLEDAEDKVGEKQRNADMPEEDHAEV